MEIQEGWFTAWKYGKTPLYLVVGLPCFFCKRDFLAILEDWTYCEENTAERMMRKRNR